MQHDSTEKLLKTVRRRLWLANLIDRGWFGLMLTSCCLALAAVLHLLHVALPLNWWGPAVLLPLAVATVAAAFNRPSLAASARTTDRCLNTHDLLTAAWYLRSQTPRPASIAALVVLDQANQVAAAPPHRLPRLTRAGRPLPRAISVAVAATSLFFLSFQGAVPSSSLPSPVPDESRVQSQAVEDPWLTVLQTGRPDPAPNVDARQSNSKPQGSSIGASNEPKSQAAPAAKHGDQDESGSRARSHALQAAKEGGASRVASKEQGREPSRDASEGIANLGDLEFVALQRKPAGEAVAIDRAVGAELVPSEGGPPELTVTVERVPAARAAKEPFSTGGGPAYKAFQAQYFEEISHGD
jgi:hypothetical protein